MAFWYGRPSSSEPGVQWLVLAFLIGIPTLFSSVQEIYATTSYHDDYYFLVRSSSFTLMGDYLAPIKEYLYSAFIAFSRVLGLSLRPFEIVCYGLALYVLWSRLLGVVKSQGLAFLIVLPLSLFVYQHRVFNHTTYDALQLILTPLSIGSALQVYSTKGCPSAILLAGVIAGCQTLTRPEGFLFLAPPLVSLLFVGGTSAFKSVGEGVKLLYRGAPLILVPLAFQQGMSAANRLVFGFWAPTIMNSHEFQGALSRLMSIDPGVGGELPYAPFPKTSMQKAFEVSPEFRKAQAFFDRNVDGRGYSGYERPAYRAQDGSIPGGHLQWALLEASAAVAGPKPEAMLGYLKRVAGDLQTAFDRGVLAKRSVLSTALGPGFSIFHQRFWSSLRRIGQKIMGFGHLIEPTLPGRVSKPPVEEDYDRIALRRTAFLVFNHWQLSGWLLDRELGLPNGIVLDRKALDAGLRLNLAERPDIARAVLGVDPAHSPPCLIGIELSSPGSDTGNLAVRYGDRVIEVPIYLLSQAARSGQAFDVDGVHVHVDRRVAPNFGFQRAHFDLVVWVSKVIQQIMKVSAIIAIVYLLAIALFRAGLILDPNDQKTFVLVVCIAFSVLLPKWVLLAAIDSAMYPGDPLRYLSTAAFAVWFFTSFVIAHAWQRLNSALFGSY